MVVDWRNEKGEETAVLVLAAGLDIGWKAENVFEDAVFDAVDGFDAAAVVDANGDEVACAASV